ncbi:hypothetical protein C5Y96_20395 [Blastopirellula marina]|uniref:Uncharacterized protein n=1 Tax=Blastopirellula marina TaxID=124 RepID=A0A2S8F392_9BACT|nr:hypothetical protein C5Y96_20395 [Blastopirellula marina]RCS44850.1 hypothetical protein DTL36_20425 [Bremerella cremea]
MVFTEGISRKIFGFRRMITSELVIVLSGTNLRFERSTVGHPPLIRSGLSFLKARSGLTSSSYPALEKFGLKSLLEC